MKCPKCEYLGFDTGDRCKNCGYDFSFITTASATAAPVPDLTIAPPVQPQMPDTTFWLDEFDRGLGSPVAGAPTELPSIAALPPVQARAERALPLFLPPVDADDDQPLIKLPLAPRAPLSVRKTPENPRLRAVPKTALRAKEPALLFRDESAPDPDLRLRDDAPVVMPPTRAPAVAAIGGEPGGAGARLGAVLLDHLILLAIDGAVLYFTLRMTVLPLADWRVLPLAPLAVFLGLVKFAYFCAFTAVGGQTIGKMALGLRVVTNDDERVDAACAIRRTLAGLISAASLGLAFLPALVGGTRRALHDRLAHTRVVAQRPA